MGKLVIFSVSSIEGLQQLYDVNLGSIFYGRDDTDEYFAINGGNFYGNGGNDIYYMVPRDKTFSQNGNFYGFSNDVNGNNNDILDFTRFALESATIDDMIFSFLSGTLVIGYFSDDYLYVCSIVGVTASGGLSSYTNRDVETFRSDLKNGTGGLTGDNACRNFFRFADMSECP